jgi:hypothetical protein
VPIEEEEEEVIKNKIKPVYIKELKSLVLATRCKSWWNRMTYHAGMVDRHIKHRCIVICRNV